MVEQPLRKRQVVGSTPILGSRYEYKLRGWSMFTIKSNKQRRETAKRLKGLEDQIRGVREKQGPKKAEALARSLRHHIGELRGQVRVYEKTRRGG